MFSNQQKDYFSFSYSDGYGGSDCYYNIPTKEEALEIIKTIVNAYTTSQIRFGNILSLLLPNKPELANLYLRYAHKSWYTINQLQHDLRADFYQDINLLSNCQGILINGTSSFGNYYQLYTDNGSLPVNERRSPLSSHRRAEAYLPPDFVQRLHLIGELLGIEVPALRILPEGNLIKRQNILESSSVSIRAKVLESIEASQIKLGLDPTSARISDFVTPFFDDSINVSDDYPRRFKNLNFPGYTRGENIIFSRFNPRGISHCAYHEEWDKVNCGLSTEESVKQVSHFIERLDPNFKSLCSYFGSIYERAGWSSVMNYHFSYHKYCPDAVQFNCRLLYHELERSSLISDMMHEFAELFSERADKANVTQKQISNEMQISVVKFTNMMIDLYAESIYDVNRNSLATLCRMTSALARGIIFNDYLFENKPIGDSFIQDLLLDNKNLVKYFDVMSCLNPPYPTARSFIATQKALHDPLALGQNKSLDPDDFSAFQVNYVERDALDMVVCFEEANASLLQELHSWRRKHSVANFDQALELFGTLRANKANGDIFNLLSQQMLDITTAGFRQHQDNVIAALQVYEPFRVREQLRQWEAAHPILAFIRRHFF